MRRGGPPDQGREQLIDAALRVILRQECGGVSIEAVARATRVTRPVVYDHFAGLGGLLQALVEREERHSLTQLEQVPPSDLDVELPARAIRDLGESAGRMLLTDPERYTPERYEHFVESVMKLIRPQ